MQSRIVGAILAGALLMRPSVPAHAKVTGVRFEPKDPIVGQTVTAIAVDDRKHEVVEWRWSGTLTDAGTYSMFAMRSTAPGRATRRIHCGGTYKVSLRVRYGGPTPPPDETVTATLNVARPDGLRIIKGLDQEVTYYPEGSGIDIRSRVLCGKAEVGEDLGGMAQRRIRNRTWWDGKADADRPWEPEAPGDHILQQFGVITSLVILKVDPAEWAKVPVGKPVVTWDEDLQLVYGMGNHRYREGGLSFGGGGKYVIVECPLGTEHLAIVKIDAANWAVRERARADQVSPPASRSSTREPAP